MTVGLRAAGIPSSEIRGLHIRLRHGFEEVDAPPWCGFLRALHSGDLLAEIRAAARSIGTGVRDVVQLGIGGSSLGAQTLLAALAGPGRHPRPRLHCPDNVDPEGFGALLDGLDPTRTVVHVVSKSGGTLETLAQLDALRAAFGRRFDPARQLLVTTGKRGVLRELASRTGARRLTFPEDVAGRYSVFTASGLLLPAIAGVRVERILAGARRLEARCRRDPLLGPAGRLAAVHYLQDVEYGRPIQVQMVYSDALVPAGYWFRQIWAESLGKEGRGPTPIVARGTTDQHSQIQLYVDGPDDKLYTLVRVDRFRRSLRVGRRAELPVLAGRDLGEVMDAEARGTAEALREKGRPLVSIRIARTTPESVGELLMMQQLQTAIAGRLYGVDPFVQPGVEAGKRAALRILAAGGTRRGRRPTGGSRPG